MKNKKGFTLIEIMAVIIILAIIAVIVVPLVTGSIKDSKDKLYETQLENIKSAAKSYMINLDLDDEQNKISVTIEELKKLGLLDKDIKDPRTDKDFDKCLTVEVEKNGNIYEYKIIEDIKDCDEVGSVIMTLIGSLNETAYLDKEYIDPGVILKTDKGKYLDIDDITVEISKYKDGNKIDTIVGKYSDLTNLIDTSDYYKYEITYKYEGPEGSASKVRKVEVKDEGNLACLILPLGTKNENGWITDDERVMIISINTNKKVEYSISETNEKIYAANKQILNVKKDGNLQIYGYIRDEEGNEAACSTSNLKYEMGNPSCNINLVGTKSSTGWYISDVTANLVPNVISEIVNRGISLNNTVDYNGEPSMKVSSSGNIYGYIKDEAGKEAKCSNNAKIDKTSSILVSINGVLEGTNTSYTPGTKATSNIVLTGIVKPGTTPSGYKYQWYKDNVAITGATRINYTAATSGNYKLVVTSGSGMTGISNTVNVVIETSRPTCSLNITSGTLGKNGWYTSNVTVGMSKTDATYYGMTTNNTVNYNNLTNQTLSSTGYAYCYVANSSKTITNSNSKYVKIDTTPPTVSLTGVYVAKDAYNTESLNLVAAAIDNESGIDTYTFYQVGAYNKETLLETNKTGTYVANSLIGTSEELKFKVVVCNNAGLCSETKLEEECREDASLTTECANGYRTKGQTCTGTGRHIYYTDSTGCETTSSGGGSSSGGSGSGCQGYCCPRCNTVHDYGDGQIRVPIGGGPACCSGRCTGGIPSCG